MAKLVKGEQYEVAIVGILEWYSKRTRKHHLMFTFETGSGERLYRDFAIESKKMLFEFKELLEACEIEVRSQRTTVDIDELIGKRLIATVSTEQEYVAVSFESSFAPSRLRRGASRCKTVALNVGAGL
jgi:hypothetical protein